MDFNDIQRHLDDVMKEQNNRSLPEFEGYSPLEMHRILHFTFGAECPVKLQKLSDAEYDQIPLLHQIKLLAEMIDKNGEIKLTNKGFLPTKIVSDLYHQGHLKDERIEKGFVKLYKETDSITVNLTRVLTELAGLTKKRDMKLSLTKSSAKILSDNHELLKLILTIFTEKFNWAYYDGYGENHIGQLGYGFSLILLSKYGQEKRQDTFYATRYFAAFPNLLDAVNPDYGTLESYSANCYSLRTFDRFMDYFGLASISVEGKGPDSKKYIEKTGLSDRLIKIEPHRKF